MPIDVKLHKGNRLRAVGMALLLTVAALWPFQLARTAWGNEPAQLRLAIITPPDKSVMESSLTNLSVSLEPHLVDEIQIFANGRKVKLPKRPLRQYTACFEGIELSLGMNDIKVVALKGGQKQEERQIKVFRRSDLFAGASSAPGSFKRYLFHNPEQEKGCMPCHQLDFSAFGEEVSSAESSPCHQCHKKILNNYGTVHGPAAVWSCLSCHDKKASQKLAVVKPDSAVCDGCHENSWKEMKFGHGPTAAGSCATCHDPHASDYPFFLRTSLSDICVGCHEEILYKPHVLIGFSNNGHPVRKSIDPYHPGRPFTCVSCHNPHAGASWTFLQNYDGASDMSNFCLTCHKM